MALTKQMMTRVFNYAGVRLPDPDPTMSLTEVRDFFASTGRPELTSAEVRGPEVIGAEQVYTLHRVTGTKGATPASCTLTLTHQVSAKARRLAAADLDRLRNKRQREPLSRTDAAAIDQLTTNRGATPVFLPAQVQTWIA